MIAYIKFDDEKRGKTYFDFRCDSVYIDSDGTMIFTGVKEPKGQPKDWLTIRQVVNDNALTDKFAYDEEAGTVQVECSDMLHVQIEE